MHQTRKSTIELSKRLTVTLKELPELLGCGQQTANEIAEDAKARVYRGKRILINVEKIQKYLNEESL